MKSAYLGTRSQTLSKFAIYTYAVQLLTKQDVIPCRRRRLIDMLGLLGSEGESEEGLSKEDHSDIEQLLMTSLDDEGRNK